jgi:hypothetical protein
MFRSQFKLSVVGVPVNERRYGKLSESQCRERGKSRLPFKADRLLLWGLGLNLVVER